MNLETVTHELLDASVEELAQTLRLIAKRSLALHDTVVIDRGSCRVIGDPAQRRRTRRHPRRFGS